MINTRITDNRAQILSLANQHGIKSMKIFGSSLNSHFGDVFETGMLITIDDIYEDKKERYIKSYLKLKSSNSLNN